MLAITTAVYSYWAGARTANGAPGAFAWAVLAVLLVISAVGGWAVAAAMKRSWRRRDQGDHELWLLSPDVWGEPDLAPPSTSPEALAEVAELEALWRQSRRRRRAGTDYRFTSGPAVAAGRCGVRSRSVRQQPELTHNRHLVPVHP